MNNLRIYRDAVRLVVPCRPLWEKLAACGQREEANQLKRSAPSVPRNIAEGTGRYDGNGRQRFETASGSARESIGTLEIAVDGKLGPEHGLVARREHRQHRLGHTHFDEERVELRHLDDHGVLIFDTFGVGNEQFGRPRNPDFLLTHNELRNWFSDWDILHYAENYEPTPPRFFASLVARKPAA